MNLLTAGSSGQAWKTFSFLAARVSIHVQFLSTYALWYTPKTLVSSRCKWNLFHILKSAGKKNRNKVHIYRVYDVQCVRVRHVLSDVCKPKRVYSNLLLEIRLLFFFSPFLFSVFPTKHPSGSIKRFVLSSKKTPHIIWGVEAHNASTAS